MKAPKHGWKLIVRSSIVPLLLIVILLCLSCKKETKKVEAKPAPSIEKGCIIFLDVSVSMRGFFGIPRPGHGSPAIQKLLRSEMRNVISRMHLGPINFSRFSTEVHQPQRKQNIGDMFVFDSTAALNQFFSGNSTDIIAVFNRQEFRKYTAAMIVTDGIQANAEGFDIGEIVRAVRKRIEEGLHIYLVGVRSEFRGFIYPEHPDSQGYTHPFPYPGGGGPRPVYIWIAAQDATIGATLAREIASVLRRDLISDNAVRSASLTDVQLPQIGGLRLDADATEHNDRIRMIARGQNTTEIRLAGSLRDDLVIPIRLSGIIGSDEWRLRLQLEPQNRWASVTETQGDWNLSLITSRVPIGTNELKITVLATPPDPHQWWWRQWSTRDDSRPEDADKTLYLEDFAKALIEPIYNRQYIIRSMNLKVVR